MTLLYLDILYSATKITPNREAVFDANQGKMRIKPCGLRPKDFVFIVLLTASDNSPRGFGQNELDLFSSHPDKSLMSSFRWRGYARVLTMAT